MKEDEMRKLREDVRSALLRFDESFDYIREKHKIPQVMQEAMQEVEEAMKRLHRLSGYNPEVC